MSEFEYFFFLPSPFFSLGFPRVPLRFYGTLASTMKPDVLTNASLPLTPYFAEVTAEKLWLVICSVCENGLEVLLREALAGFYTSENKPPRHWPRALPPSNHYRPIRWGDFL